MASNKVGKEFWAEYAEKRQRAQEEAERMAEEHEERLEIIEPSRPVTTADLNASIIKAVALLTIQGYYVGAELTRVLQVGTLIKSGEKEGQMRPDKELTNFFLYGARDDRRIVSAWYVDGKLQSAKIGVHGGAVKLTDKVGELETFIEEED